jgi:hypothetical protein
MDGNIPYALFDSGTEAGGNRTVASAAPKLALALDATSTDCYALFLGDRASLTDAPKNR